MPTAPLVIPGAVKIEMLGTLASRQCVNVYGGIWIGSAPTGAQLLTAAAAILSSWKTRFNPLFSDAYTVNSCRITSLETSTAPQAISSSGGNGTKANGSPAQVAQIIKLITATRSRSARGRIFLPPPGDLDVNSAGVLLAAQITDLGTAMSGHITAMAAASVNLAVISRTLMVANQVTSYVVESTVATQRRRLRG